MPLVGRVAALKIPITFVCKLLPLTNYSLICLSPDGDSDWMDPEADAKAIDNPKATGNSQSRLYTIKHAGHHRKPSSLFPSRFA